VVHYSKSMIVMNIVASLASVVVAVVMSYSNAPAFLVLAMSFAAGCFALSSLTERRLPRKQ
jgi:zinc transporter ZupT